MTLFAFGVHITYQLQLIFSFLNSTIFENSELNHLAPLLDGATLAIFKQSRRMHSRTVSISKIDIGTIYCVKGNLNIPIAIAT